MPLKSKSKLVGIPTADGKFRCIWCPKTYCKSKHARRHMLLHTGERPYDCPHCTMNFTRADIRKRHVIKCAQKQEDSVKPEEIKIESVEPVAAVEPVEYSPEFFEEPQQQFDEQFTEEPQFPYYFFESLPQQQQQQQQHIPQQQQHIPQQQQHQQQQHQQLETPLTPMMEPLPMEQLPMMELMTQPVEPMVHNISTAASKFPLLQQHPTLYAHDDHVNLSNLIDSLSQSALPLHYQLLHSDSDSLESISETSASDEGEFFEPLNWSLEGLM